MNQRVTEESGPLRVLLVEDHADLAAATEVMLRSEGLEVETALSGRQALDLAAALSPDLVLVDLSLPDMTGLDVIRGLRSSPSTARACIVVLSAMSGLDQVDLSDDKGPRVDASFSKPIQLDAIQALVQTTRATARNRTYRK
jgi:CheY-like chemotaxis protein